MIYIKQHNGPLINPHYNCKYKKDYKLVVKQVRVLNKKNEYEYMDKETAIAINFIEVEKCGLGDFNINILEPNVEVILGYIEEATASN